MARLIVDSSDDDLPDLASVLKSKPQSAKSRSSEMATKKPQSRKERSLEGTESTAKESAATRRGYNTREESPEILTRKPTARRRILKPATENPLLLPFSSNGDDESKRPRAKITQIEGRFDSKLKDISMKKEIPRATHERRETPDLEPSSDEDNVVRDDIKGRNENKTTTGRSIKEFSQPQRKTATTKNSLSRAGSRQASYKKQDISEDEEVIVDGSSDMFDFVVEDEESIFEYSDDEDSILPPPPPPPKSPRKLVRGRKPEQKISADEDIFGRRKPVGEESKDIDELGNLISEIDIRKGVGRGNEEGRDIPRSRTNSSKQGVMLPPSRHSTSLDKQSAKFLPSSSFEHPSAILEFSPPRLKSPSKIIPSDSSSRPIVTPPASPSKNPLRSPKKPFVSIPPIPYSQTAAEFWAQDIMNDWVDKHSPKKEASPPKPRHQPLSPSKSKMTSSEIDTKRFKADFENVKEHFAVALLEDLDKTVTSGQLSKLFESTGGIKLQWSKTLKKTAGQAFYKRSVNGNGTHSCLGRIELATKVVDDENRLINTLSHEFCHLATFAIDKQTKKPHGAEFQRWGRIVEQAGPGLVRRHLERDFKGFRAKWKCPKIVIKVSTCHSYEIDFKYEWQCTTPNCGIIYHRHSKSIKPSIHSCGKCKGLLTQIKPAPRNNNTNTTKSSVNSSISNLLNPFAALSTAENGKGKGKEKEGGLNEYQQFVKDNMARIKAENPGSPQKDMMGFLSRSYREMKASRLRDRGTDLVPKFGELAIGEKIKDGREELVEVVGEDEEEDVFFDADQGDEEFDNGGGKGKDGSGRGGKGFIDLVSDDEGEENDDDVFWA